MFAEAAAATVFTLVSLLMVLVETAAATVFNLSPPSLTIHPLRASSRYLAIRVTQHRLLLLYLALVRRSEVFSL